MSILGKEFFDRSSVVVAEELLGKSLVRRSRGKAIAYMITETEAYDGPHDKASHASKGKTPRTAVMFGPSGYWYVYLIYGMYWMLNIVTDAEEYPSAVLIRGVEGIDGPGKLTRECGITKRYDGMRADEVTGLWIEDRGVVVPKERIARTARVGVGYAGPEWAEKEYRFVFVDR